MYIVCTIMSELRQVHRIVLMVDHKRKKVYKAEARKRGVSLSDLIRIAVDQDIATTRKTTEEQR